MAKKKVSSNSTTRHQDFVKPTPNQPPMDSEAADKHDNLKSLNQMLLKETYENRQHIETLEQLKLDLQSELTRSNSDNQVLKSELTQLSDEAARLELERSVVAEFASVQVVKSGEVAGRRIEGLESAVEELRSVIVGKEREIGVLRGKMVEIEGLLGGEREVSKRVCVERDEVRVRLDEVVKESEGLRGNLKEMEKRKREMEREIGELRAAFDGVVVEKEERERRIESVTKEKDSLARGLDELNELVVKTKEELRGVVREKEGVEKEKNAEVIKRIELEKLVSGLNETVGSLRKEEERLLVNLAELERKCVEGEEKQKGMRMEIDRLVEETEWVEKEKYVEVMKRVELEKLVGELNETVVGLRKEEQVLLVNLAELERKCVEGEELQKGMRMEIVRLVEDSKSSEKRVRGLIDEKSVVEKDLGESLSRLDDERHKVENLVKEKIVLLEAKHILEEEGFTLQNQAAELKDAVLDLEKSRRVKEEKIQSLESVVDEYKQKLELVEVERADIINSLDKEKHNVVKLTEQMKDMEKKSEETLKVAEEAKAENDAILVEKNRLEGQCESLKKEIASLEKVLAEAKKEFNSMERKVESSEQVLNMLKDVAAFCSSDEINTYSKQINVEGRTPRAVEFEKIKDAFASKEAEIETMKKQVDVLQVSVQEAQKKRSFWAVLSSATTVVAFASLAYVARGTGR